MHKLLIAAAINAAFLIPTAQAQVSVPNAFTAGAPARAADVNANFQALVAGINALGTRVAKLEGTVVAADLVGAYTINQFQSELGGGASSKVAIYTGGGTVTFAANGSATFAGNTELGHELRLPSGALNPINRPQPTFTEAWSFAAGKVSFLGISFSVADGGRLLIGTSANPADGSNVLLLLTRTN